MNSSEQAARGYFALGDHEESVSITSDKDFLMYIWAHNVEIFPGGVQVMTPPSRFRTAGSNGPHDALTLSLAAQSNRDLGCIGACGGETVEISNAGGARVTAFVTVVTDVDATVQMNMKPASP